MSTSREVLRDQIRDHLKSIASQAAQAKKLAVKSDDDTLCDVIDDIDNELQTVIELVNLVRRKEVT